MTVFQSAEYDELLGFPLPKTRGSFVTSNSYFMSSKRPYGLRSGVAGVRPILCPFLLWLNRPARVPRAWARRLSPWLTMPPRSTGTRPAWRRGRSSVLCWITAKIARNRLVRTGRQAARRESQHFIGFTIPPFGLGYYRRSMAATTHLTPEGMAGPSREDGRQSVQELTTSNIGVSLAQSMNDYIVVAGHGEVRQRRSHQRCEYRGRPVRRARRAGLVRAPFTSRVDVDAGAMVAVEQWRLGVVARNLTTP